VPGTCLGGGLAYQDVAVSSVAVRGLITNASSSCIGRSLLILERTGEIYAVYSMWQMIRDDLPSEDMV